MYSRPWYQHQHKHQHQQQVAGFPLLPTTTMQLLWSCTKISSAGSSTKPRKSPTLNSTSTTTRRSSPCCTTFSRHATKCSSTGPRPSSRKCCSSTKKRSTTTSARRRTNWSLLRTKSTIPATIIVTNSNCPNNNRYSNSSNSNSNSSWTCLTNSRSLCNSQGRIHKETFSRPTRAGCATSRSSGRRF